MKWRRRRGGFERVEKRERWWIVGMDVLFSYLLDIRNVFAKLRDIVLEFGTPTNSVVNDFAKLRRCEYLQWCLHEKAEDFRPEMWERRKIGWEGIPFGGGARRC
ncbi:hypothetical protein BKA61DRAFT_214085 [Leptodontidium sp. MPI-SDFR-AT-0119]|nr:hypothetical protein BKA61DRAFT_214085 [Leptodontidium sp. MPI-SDFR-AT-0119]